jgi:arylamine N-acetyltransferase
MPRRARIEVGGDAFVLTDLSPEEGWSQQLRASFEPRRLTDFTPRSEYLKAAPDLGWAHKPFATRALDGEGSRMTLRRDVLRRRTGTGPYVETPVAEEEWSDLLAEHFDLVDTLTR